MTPRKWIGIVAGLVAAGAVLWLGYDLILLLRGPGHRNAITTLALIALMILIGGQVGAKVGWGVWAGDRTFPPERWFIAIGVAAVVLVLSVVPN